MYYSVHDEAQARLAGHSEMDVHEAQGPKPKVMETVGQNGQKRQRHERLGYFHAKVWQVRQRRGILRWRLGLRRH